MRGRGLVTLAVASLALAACSASPASGRDFITMSAR